MNSLWDILSVAIGISFIFLVLSILNSWIQEYVATLFELRARNLADVMQNLLEPGVTGLNGNKRAFEFAREAAVEANQPTAKKKVEKPNQAEVQNEAENPNKLAEQFDEWKESTEEAVQSVKKRFEPSLKLKQLELQQQVLSNLVKNPVKMLYMHPIIHSLSRPDKLPDHLPGNDFTVALLDLLDDIGREGRKSSSSLKITMAHIKTGIDKLVAEGSPLGNRLLPLVYSSQIHVVGKERAGLVEFHKAVSEWYEDTVARGSVWFKRKMQRLGIFSGLILAIVLNADTIGLSNALWHNAVLRNSIVQAAEANANPEQVMSGEEAQQQLTDLSNFGLPIGWVIDADPDNPRALPSTPEGWVAKSIGLLLTGFAISQGSQIWFDLMNRLLNLRPTGASPEEQVSKDKSK